MEEQIDTEMKKMDELDDDDIEKIRQRRLKAMQKAHQAKQVSGTPRCAMGYHGACAYSFILGVFAERSWCL